MQLVILLSTMGGCGGAGYVNPSFSIEAGLDGDPAEGSVVFPTDATDNDVNDNDTLVITPNFWGDGSVYYLVGAEAGADAYLSQACDSNCKTLPEAGSTSDADKDDAECHHHTSER
jgi:hypothetical protein